jgi:hypothetical protein
MNFRFEIVERNIFFLPYKPPRSYALQIKRSYHTYYYHNGKTGGRSKHSDPLTGYPTAFNLRRRHVPIIVTFNVATCRQATPLKPVKESGTTHAARVTLFRRKGKRIKSSRVHTAGRLAACMSVPSTTPATTTRVGKMEHGSMIIVLLSPQRHRSQQTQFCARVELR